jgi:signal transduction histidine kinase
MGIRKRLLVLSIGIAVPLTIVGLVMLWGLWQRSRSELDHSIQGQSDLAAVAFEKWLDGQRQPLVTLATIVSSRPNDPLPQERLSYILKTGPHWIDLQILDASGTRLVAEPIDSPPLPKDLLDPLRTETQQRNSWTVATDWTRGEGHPVLALGVPIPGGGMIVARIDGIAMVELFRTIELSNGAIIAVFDSQRRVLYRSSTENAYFGTNRSNSPLFTSLAGQSKVVVEATSPYDGIERVYGLSTVNSCDCVVAVGVPSATLYSPARKQITAYLVISFVALLSAVSAAVLIARRIAQPISRLRDAAHEFGSGNLNSRARVNGGGELEELGAAFDEMAEKIETRTLRLAELDRLKSEFVGGVSHELRTPLTTIKTLTRVLLRGGETNDERKEYLETIAAECDRQIDLVLNLLDLSRLEAGKFSVTCMEVDVAGIVRNCAAMERHAAQARAHKIVVDLPESKLPAFADASALRRIICGLIENAIKYTSDGGRITLAAQLYNGEVVVSVSDNGCGISAADLPHIFEKFYRGHPASSFINSSNSDALPQAPGVGLGLYLARTLVTQLGGRISVEAIDDRGTTFTVYLPAVETGSKPHEERQDVETVAHS